jgi:hypothetical protein
LPRWPPFATTRRSAASSSTSGARSRSQSIGKRRGPSSSPTPRHRALRGRGIASELVKDALELIRADGHKVIAGCGFVVDYLDKHPEYRELMA